MIELVIVVEPRGKGMARTFMLNNRPVTTTAPATRKYETILRDTAIAQHTGRLLDGPLSVHIQAWMPIRKSWTGKKKRAARAGAIYPTGKPDWDNIAKSVGDALKGVCWVDDAIIIDGHVNKRYSDFPRLVVRVREVEPQEFDEDLPF